MPDSQFPSSSSSLPHVQIWGWEIFPSFDHRSLEAHAFPRIIMWEILQTRKSNFSHRLTIGRLSPPVCLYPPFLCLFFRWELGTLWIGMFWRPEYPKKIPLFEKANVRFDPGCHSIRWEEKDAIPINRGGNTFSVQKVMIFFVSGEISVCPNTFKTFLSIF